MTKIPTVAIALSAFNEESNIINFLNSVIMQREEGFYITRILILNDGSSDRTSTLLKNYKDKRVVVKNFKNRTGKSVRLNEIYQNITEDFLVQTDADVIFSHEFVVRDMIKPFMNNSKLGMCGGNPIPFKAETFVEQAINYTVGVYEQLRSTVRGGNNVFSVDGRLLSYRSEWLKGISVPHDMIANDMFTFFECKSRGFDYKFVKTGIVYFRSPQSISDQIRQNTRFRAAPIRMKKYFDKNLVEKELKIDIHLLLYFYLVTFIKHPIHCIFIYTLNLYTKILAKVRESELTAQWDMATTTKKLKYV